MLNCHRFKILQQSEQATSNDIQTRSWKWYWTWYSPGNFFSFSKHMLTHTEHFQCLSNYATHLGKKNKQNKNSKYISVKHFSSHLFFALVNFHILVNAFSTNWKSCALPKTFLFLLLTRPHPFTLKHTQFRWFFWHPTTDLKKTLHLMVKMAVLPIQIQQINKDHILYQNTHRHSI